MTGIRKEMHKDTMDFSPWLQWHLIILDFYAIKSDINNSKEIQLIDIILGCYLTYDKCFDEKRIFFRKI